MNDTRWENTPINEIKPGCGNCWFYWSGKCNYAVKCNGEKKWSNLYNSFIPTNYQERKNPRW